MKLPIKSYKHLNLHANLSKQETILKQHYRGWLIPNLLSSVAAKQCLVLVVVWVHSKENKQKNKKLGQSGIRTPDLHDVGVLGRPTALSMSSDWI